MNEENSGIGDHVKIHIETKERSDIPSTTELENENEHRITKRQDIATEQPVGTYPQSSYEPTYAYPAHEERDTYKPRVHVSIEAEKRDSILRHRKVIEGVQSQSNKETTKRQAISDTYLNEEKVPGNYPRSPSYYHPNTYFSQEDSLADADYKPRVHVSIQAEKRADVQRRARRDLSMEYTKNIVVPNRAENNMGVVHVNRVNEDIENAEKRSKILKVEKRALYGPLFRIDTGFPQRRATIRGTKALKNPIVQLLRAAAGQKTQKILGLNSKAFDIFPGPLPDETNAALDNNLGKVSSEAPTDQLPESVDQQIIQTFKPSQQERQQQQQQQYISSSGRTSKWREPSMAQIFQQPNSEAIPGRSMVGGSPFEHFNTINQQQQQQQQPEIITAPAQQQDFAPQLQQQQQQQELMYRPQEMEVGQEVIQNADFLREQPQFPSFPSFERRRNNNNMREEAAMQREAIMQQQQNSQQQMHFMQQQQQQQPLQQASLREWYPSLHRQQPHSSGLYQRQRVREMGGQTRAMGHPTYSRPVHMYENGAQLESALPNRNFIGSPQENEMLNSMAHESSGNVEMSAFDELRKGRRVEDVQPFVLPQVETNQQQEPVFESAPGAEQQQMGFERRQQNQFLQTRHELPLTSLLSNRLFQMPGENEGSFATAATATSEQPSLGIPNFVGTSPLRRRQRFHHIGLGTPFYHHSAAFPHFDPNIVTRPVFAHSRHSVYRNPVPMMYNPNSFVQSHIPSAPQAVDDDDDDFEEKPEVHVHVTTEKSHISKPADSTATVTAATAKKSESLNNSVGKDDSRKS